MTIKAFCRDGLYIPIRHVTDEQYAKVEKRFERDVYKDERVCEACDYFSERPCDVCDNCPNYEGKVKMHSIVKRDSGKEFLRLPFGARERVDKIFGGVQFVNKNEDVPMRKAIEFTGKLRDDQKGAVKKMFSSEFGVLKSPPRSGKCIVGSSLIMTSRGLQPIREHFEDYSLNKDKETVINLSPRLPIATVNGERKVSHLYTKVVDETYSLRTSHGYSIRGTPAHPVRVATPTGLRWKKLSEVSVGDMLAVSRRPLWLGSGNALSSDKVDYRNTGDSHDLQTVPKTMSVKLARLLGYWVANGSLSIPGRLSITSNNMEVRQDFMHCLRHVFPGLHTVETKPKKGKAKGVRTSSRQIAKFLSEVCGLTLGVAKDKSVPTSLMSMDRKFILAFLGAYTTCDAWVHKHGIQYCSASKQLMTELHVILTHLGVVGKLSKSRSCARNGSQILRNYWYINLHKQEADKLMRLLTIRKDHELADNTVYIDQHDIIPFAKTLLKRVSDKYTGSTHKQWKYKGREVSKQKVGGLLRVNRRGLAKGGHYTRDKLSNVNTYVLGKLDTLESKRLHALANPDIFFTPVTRIEKIEKPVRVYDVSVPNGEQFVANGIVNHNTVMGAYLVCKLSQKTLILAAQKDWLDNFHETFVGSETQDPLTTIRKKRIGFPKTLAEFEQFDICLVTYQKFLSPKGKKLLKAISKMFGILLIDEVQTVGAKEFATVVGKIHARYKIGLSGTPQRKDSKEFIIYSLLGPIFYENKVEKLRPRLEYVHTELRGKMPQQWTYIVNKIEKDPARLKLIAQTAIADIKAKHLVFIPLTRVAVIKALTKAINQMVGKTVAASFYGGISKDARIQLVQRARDYKIQIVVGNTRLISTGLNIPRASMLYQASPASNLPKAEQRFARILTPYEDKPEPVIKYFLDDVDVVRACMRKEHWQCLVPQFRPRMTGHVKKVLEDYFKNSKKAKSDSYTGGYL